ncbi:Polyprenyl synthetase, partial [mine drainage metagenome]
MKSYLWADKEDWLNRVSSEITDIMLSYLPYKDRGEYYEGLTDYMNKGGHFTRPKLFLLTARALDVPLNRDLMLLAATIEMSEEAILKYDDIQDHSVKRRGMESTNYKYGDEKAILFASVLHDKNRQMFEDYLTSLDDKATRYRLKDKYDEIADATAYGQYLELNFIKTVHNFSTIEEMMRNEGRRDFDLYYDIVKGKTCAYSTWGPMQMAAIIADKDDELLDIIKEVGELAGIAFQINDDLEDILNFRKDKERDGDLKEGKYTLIMAYAYKNASDDEKKFIDMVYAKNKEQKTEAEIKKLKKIIYRTGAITYALDIRDSYMKRTIAEIDRYSNMLPSNKFAIALAELITGLLSREGVDMRTIALGRSEGGSAFTDLYSMIKPVLFKADPEKINSAAETYLRMSRSFPELLRPFVAKSIDYESLHSDVFGTIAKTPVGLAAGFDKNARLIIPTYNLGFGFSEVGSVTPMPQLGNGKPRLFRYPNYRSIQNMMGFNNCGEKEFARNLSKDMPFPI